MVFRISLFLVVALAAITGIAPARFKTISDAALAAVIQNAGWLYLLIVFLTLVFLASLAFGPAAVLRIGGRDAEPEFSKSAWLSMLFAAGMAIALIAASMLIAGGLDALQTLITVAALPFALLAAVMVGLYRVLSLEALREKAAKRRARRAIEDRIAREQRQKAHARRMGNAADDHDH